MNADHYLHRVNAALAGIEERDRRRVLTMLQDEFEQAERAGGRTAVLRLIDDLGDPDRLVACFEEALTDDLDGTGPHRERPWPSGPADSGLWRAGGAPILHPKAPGHSLNLGALAARVGLIHPDDDDERAWAAAGPLGAVTLIGISASALIAQLLILALAWRDLPASVPTHWGLTGTPDHEVPTSLLIGAALTLAFALTAYAAIVAIRHRCALRSAVQTEVCCGLFAWATTVVTAAALLAPSAGLVVGLVAMILVLALLVVVPACVLRRGVRRLTEPHTPCPFPTARKE